MQNNTVAAPYYEHEICFIVHAAEYLLIFDDNNLVEVS